MTYESLHDDDDFRVNWCRNMDSFLFICARDDHAAPHLSLCASRAARRHRAMRRRQPMGRHWAACRDWADRRHRTVRRHWTARRDRADRIHPANGLPADACNWAPPSGCGRHWAARSDRADRL